MPVALNQLGELLTIILDEVDSETFKKILNRFRGTQAYRANSSFRETIERLDKQLTR